MLLNSLIISRLLYGCHAWRQACSEIFYASAVYNPFLRSVLVFDRMEPECFAKLLFFKSFTLAQQNHEQRTELYQTRETTSLEDFEQQQQQTTQTSQVTRRVDNNIINRSTFHTTINKKLWRKSPSTMLKAITEKSRFGQDDQLHQCPG